MCPSSGLWGGVLDCDSQFTILSPPSFDGPQLWRFTSVCSSLHLLTHAHCARCSFSIPLWLASYLLALAGGRTQSPDCALRIPVSHDLRRACLFSFLYIKLFGLGVEVALNVCVYWCVHASMHLRVYLCIYASMYLCMYVSMHVYYPVDTLTSCRTASVMMQWARSIHFTE